MKEERSGLVGEEGKLGFGVVKYTCSFGRKRILISSNEEETVPLKRLCSEGILGFEETTPSPLEMLPQEILLRILCGVEHEDLGQLIRVSKTIKDATLIARELHFQYSTPKKVRAFRDPIDFWDWDEIEPPNAPKPLKTPDSLLGGKDFGEIAVDLFTSPMRKGLFFSKKDE